MPTCQRQGCTNEVGYRPNIDAITGGYGPSTIPKRFCDSCEATRLVQNRRDEFERKLHESEIPRGMWSFDRELGNSALLDWTLAHADGWMWVAGETGVGKSRALARAAVVSAWKAEYFPGMLWLASADFFPAVGARDGKERQVGRDALAKARAVDLLILDDLGQERLTDNTRAVLFSLVDQRYRERKRTWFSTNASGAEILAHIGESRWPQIERRILERGYANTWDGEQWIEDTSKHTPPVERQWWQDM